MKLKAERNSTTHDWSPCLIYFNGHVTSKLWVQKYMVPLRFRRKFESEALCTQLKLSLMAMLWRFEFYTIIVKAMRTYNSDAVMSDPMILNLLTTACNMDITSNFDSMWGSIEADSRSGTFRTTNYKIGKVQWYCDGEFLLSFQLWNWPVTQWLIKFY